MRAALRMPRRTYENTAGKGRSQFGRSGKGALEPRRLAAQ